MKDYIKLFAVFAKIAVTTFGGGYAMMPILVKELVENRKWSTVDEILDYYAVSQCTPGIIAINVATFIGHKRKGLPGGVVATLGVITPSLIIMSIAAGVINSNMENENIEHVFSGIRLVAIALILNTVILLIRRNMRDVFSVIAFLTALAITVFLGASPIQVVIMAAIMGILHSLLVKRRMSK